MQTSSELLSILERLIILPASQLETQAELTTIEPSTVHDLLLDYLYHQDCPGAQASLKRELSKPTRRHPTHHPPSRLTQLISKGLHFEKQQAQIQNLIRACQSLVRSIGQTANNDTPHQEMAPSSSSHRQSQRTSPPTQTTLRSDSGSPRTLNKSNNNNHLPPSRSLPRRPQHHLPPPPSVSTNKPQRRGGPSPLTANHTNNNNQSQPTHSSQHTLYSGRRLPAMRNTPPPSVATSSNQVPLPPLGHRRGESQHHIDAPNYSPSSRRAFKISPPHTNVSFSGHHPLLQPHSAGRDPNTIRSQSPTHSLLPSASQDHPPRWIPPCFTSHEESHNQRPDRYSAEAHSSRIRSNSPLGDGLTDFNAVLSYTHLPHQLGMPTPHLADTLRLQSGTESHYPPISVSDSTNLLPGHLSTQPESAVVASLPIIPAFHKASCQNSPSESTATALLSRQSLESFGDEWRRMWDTDEIYYLASAAPQTSTAIAAADERDDYTSQPTSSRMNIKLEDTDNSTMVSLGTYNKKRSESTMRHGSVNHNDTDQDCSQPNRGRGFSSPVKKMRQEVPFPLPSPRPYPPLAPEAAYQMQQDGSDVDLPGTPPESSPLPEEDRFSDAGKSEMDISYEADQLEPFSPAMMALAKDISEIGTPRGSPPISRSSVPESRMTQILQPPTLQNQTYPGYAPPAPSSDPFPVSEAGSPSPPHPIDPIESLISQAEERAISTCEKSIEVTDSDFSQVPNHQSTLEDLRAKLLASRKARLKSAETCSSAATSSIAPSPPVVLPSVDLESATTPSVAPSPPVVLPSVDLEQTLRARLQTRKAIFPLHPLPNPDDELEEGQILTPPPEIDLRKRAQNPIEAAPPIIHQLPGKPDFSLAKSCQSAASWNPPFQVSSATPLTAAAPRPISGLLLPPVSSATSISEAHVVVTPLARPLPSSVANYSLLSNQSRSNVTSSLSSGSNLPWRSSTLQELSRILNPGGSDSDQSIGYDSSKATTSSQDLSTSKRTIDSEFIPMSKDSLQGADTRSDRVTPSIPTPQVTHANSTTLVTNSGGMPPSPSLQNFLVGKTPDTLIREQSSTRLQEASSSIPSLPLFSQPAKPSSAPSTPWAVDQANGKGAIKEVIVVNSSKETARNAKIQALREREALLVKELTRKRAQLKLTQIAMTKNNGNNARSCSSTSSSNMALVEVCNSDPDQSSSRINSEVQDAVNPRREPRIASTVGENQGILGQGVNCLKSTEEFFNSLQQELLQETEQKLRIEQAFEARIETLIGSEGVTSQVESEVDENRIHESVSNQQSTSETKAGLQLTEDRKSKGTEPNERVRAWQEEQKDQKGESSRSVVIKTEENEDIDELQEDEEDGSHCSDSVVEIFLGVKPDVKKIKIEVKEEEEDVKPNLEEIQNALNRSGLEGNAEEEDDDVESNSSCESSLEICLGYNPESFFHQNHNHRSMNQRNGRFIYR